MFACEFGHLVLVGAGGVALGRIEDAAEEVKVARAVEEDAGLPEDPVDGEVDLRWLDEWFVPGCGRRFFRPPWAAGDPLDRLHGDVALPAGREEWLDVGCVLGVLQNHVAVGKEDGVEGEPFEASAMHLGDREPVAGDADEPDKSLLPRLDGGPQSPFFAQRMLPLGRADEVIGWGQDGAFITGDNVNPHLAGSVFYFLEGYAVYAIRDVIGPIAEGKEVPLKADAGDPASKVQPCPVSAEQAKTVPDLAERVAALLAAPAGTTEYELFCPNK